MICRSHPDSVKTWRAFTVWFDSLELVKRRQEQMRSWLSGKPQSIVIIDPQDPRFPKDFFQRLREAFGHKCAYCEQPIAGNAETCLNLFRPHFNAVQSDDDPEISFEHYKWLWWEARNLYLSCTGCATAKKEQFPVQGKRAPLGATGEELAKEHGLLLDPCDLMVNPLTHLEFLADGQVCARAASRRGKITIDVLQLNRVELVAMRRKAAEVFTATYGEQIASAKRASKAKIDQAIDNLLRFCAYDQPFVGLKRCVLLELMKEDRRINNPRWSRLADQLHTWVPDLPSSNSKRDHGQSLIGYAQEMDSMSNSSVEDIRRRALERRLVALTEEYEAVNRQIEVMIDQAHIVRLKRRANDLLKEMNEIKVELNEINTKLGAVVPSMSPHPVILPAQVDFVIGAALEEELDAVLAKLPGARRLDPSSNGLRIYYAAQVPVTFPGGATSTYDVRVLLLGKGQEEATLAAAEAIQRWKPRGILVAGIAGGVTANDVGLGDVLVADQIVGYEMQKIKAKQVDIRWNVYKAAKGLELQARDLRVDEWQPLVTVERPEPGGPKRHIGPIASGNKVIAYDKIVQRYQGIWSQLIGVEMEAAGVAAAAFHQAQATPFFMIRGVSDLADEAKDSAEVKRWRAYACDVAAAYTVALLRRGPVPLAE